MATGANTIQHRIVSLVCLVAMLLVATPFALCAPASMAKMHGGKCDPCCPASASATAACCLAHPLPSTPVPPTAQALAILIVTELPAQQLKQPAELYRLVPTGRDLPPPLLRTNLRI